MAVKHGSGGGSNDEDGTANAEKWTQVAITFVADWKMLAKEIEIGFLLAGFIASLVLADWWRTLFLNSGAPAMQLVELHSSDARWLLYKLPKDFLRNSIQPKATGDRAL